MIATATALEPQYVAMPLTKEWFAARSTGLGASQAAAACGLSEYETPLHVYLRARGELPPLEETDAMRLGTKLEPIIISEFVHATGIQVKRAPCPMYRHANPDLHFMLATPDAELVGDDLLEAKSTNWRLAKQLGEEGTDFIPERWVLQGQQQMEVMGRDTVHLAALIDGRTLRTFRIERNDALIARMAEIEGELWQRIIDGCAPEPSWNHPATADLVKEMHGVATGKTIILPNSVAELWRQQQTLAEQIKTLEAARETLRAQVAHAMGDSAIALFESTEAGPCEFEVTRSTVNRSSYVVKETSYVTLRSRKSK